MIPITIAAAVAVYLVVDAVRMIRDEYSICIDCEYYVTYGRLDDMTMMEIEK